MERRLTRSMKGGWVDRRLHCGAGWVCGRHTRSMVVRSERRARTWRADAVSLKLVVFARTYRGPRQKAYC